MLDNESIAHTYTQLIKQVSIETLVHYLDGQTRWKLFIELCLGHAKVRGGRSRDFPFSVQRQLNIQLSSALINDVICLGQYGQNLSSSQVSKYDFLLASALLDITQFNAHEQSNNELYFCSAFKQLVDQVIPTKRERKLVMRHSGASSQGEDNKITYYPKENIKVALLLAALAREPLAAEMTRSEASQYLLQLIPAELRPFVQQTLNLIIIKPKHVQTLLERCKKSYIQRGASYWSSQVVARVRDIIECQQGGLSMLLTDSDSVSIIATSSNVQPADLQQLVRLALCDATKPELINFEFIQHYYPRVLPYLEHANAQNIHTASVLPAVYLNVYQNVSLLDLLVDRSSLLDWVRPQDQSSNTLFFSNYSDLADTCTGRRGDEALDSASLSVPNWYRKEAGDSYGWGAIFFSLVGMSYKSFSNLSLQETVNAHLNKSVRMVNTLNELCTQTECNSKRVAFLKFDGDKIGEKFTSLPPYRRASLGIQLEQLLRDAIIHSVEKVITAFDLDILPVEVIYYGGDDILLAMDHALIDTFLASFDHWITANTVNCAVDNTTLPLNDLTLSFVVMECELVSKNLQPPSEQDVQNHILKLLNLLIDRVKEGVFDLAGIALHPTFKLMCLNHYQLNRIKGMRLNVMNIAQIKHSLPPLAQQALDFALQAHGGIDQRRKYDKSEYIVHPISVMQRIRNIEHSAEMLAAALLHDTVEDTPTTLNDIRSEFGDDVANLVFYLTDKSKPEDGNRAKRKEIDRAHIALAPPQAKSIKLADMIDNSDSIIKNDPRFAKLFLAEFKLLLEVLSEGNNQLFEQAKAIVT